MKFPYHLITVLLLTITLVAQASSCRYLLEQASYPTLEDTADQVLDRVMLLEVETWPEGTRGARENFNQRLVRFPEGFIRGIDTKDGKTVGLTTSMIIHFNGPTNIQTWETVTTDGSIANHDPKGNALYIVSVGVAPSRQRQGLGTQLVGRQVELAKSLGLKAVVLGSRVPGFHLYSGSIESYLAERDPQGYSIDAEIRFYQKCGFSVRAIKPSYMLDDAESKNFGVLMVQEL